MVFWFKPSRPSAISSLPSYIAFKVLAIETPSLTLRTSSDYPWGGYGYNLLEVSKFEFCSKLMFDFQVLKEWCDIDSVHIDDLQETGNEQILLLPYNFIIPEGNELNLFSFI